MSNQQIPPAVRGCQFCGCPANQIKLLINPVAEVMRDMRMCNRYCPICTAQAPIAVWDRTDPKCIIIQSTTDEIAPKAWIALVVSDNTFLTIGLSKKGPCEFLLKLPASLSDAEAVNSLVDTLRNYVTDLDVFESIQVDSLTFVDQHQHRHTASVHESTSVEITSLVVKYLNYLPINPKILSVKINA